MLTIVILIGLWIVSLFVNLIVAIGLLWVVNVFVHVDYTIVNIWASWAVLTMTYSMCLKVLR